MNPLLALRIGICNQRWEETRNQAFQQRLAAKAFKRSEHQKERYKNLKQQIEHTLLRFLFLFTLHQSKTMQAPIASLSPNTGHPAPSHPWRRPLLAKK